jgi:hypothetical protein
MSALSPFYPQLRTLVGAAGTAEKCQQPSLAAFTRSPRPSPISWRGSHGQCWHKSAPMNHASRRQPPELNPFLTSGRASRLLAPKSQSPQRGAPPGARARSPHHFFRRRFLVFRGEALRAAADFSTAKSSSFAPALSFSRSHTGSAPVPARVLPSFSRYLTGTLRPFIALPRPRRPLPNSPAQPSKLVLQPVCLLAEHPPDIIPKLQKRVDRTA